jgi:hypothetical protein
MSCPCQSGATIRGDVKLAGTPLTIEPLGGNLRSPGVGQAEWSNQLRHPPRVPLRDDGAAHIRWQGTLQGGRVNVAALWFPCSL